jgi:tetratricopeptide (TPR) repeat protein
MLFAVLPAHSEAIGWIQGRVDLMAAVFVLLALWALLRAQDSPGGSGWAWGGLGGVAFFLALLAKESAAPLPLAWAAWEIAGATAGPAPPYRARLARFVPLIAAFAGYWLLRQAVVGTGALFPLSLSPLWLRLLALFRLVAEYGRVLLIPDLGLNLHRVLILQANLGTVLLAAVPAAILGGGLAVAWRRARHLFPWVAWGPIMLAPPLLFVWYAPAPDLGFFTAERFVYLPSVGWCVLFGWLLARALQWQYALGMPSAAWMTCIGLLGAYAGLTLLRLSPWADPVDLYRGMQAQDGQSEEVRLFIHNNLGGVYLDRGEFDAARQEFQAALRLQPDYSFALNNMGVLLVRQGRPMEALPWLERAIRRDPDYADAYANLGAAHEAAGDLATARSVYAAGLHRKPDSPRLLQGLVRVEAAARPGPHATKEARP